jgi:quinol monooxygenase YgiN
MFMRLTWAKLRPGMWSQYEAKYAELTRASPGLVARWLLRDTKDPDALYVISHWQDLDAMEDWETSEYFQQVFLPSIRPMLEGGFTVSVCEICRTEQPGTSWPAPVTAAPDEARGEVKP